MSFRSVISVFSSAAPWLIKAVLKNRKKCPKLFSLSKPSCALRKLALHTAGKRNRCLRNFELKIEKIYSYSKWKTVFFLLAEPCFPGHDPISVSDDSITWCGTLLGNQRHDPVVSPTFLGFLRFIVFFIIFIFIKKATRTSNLEYRCNMSTVLEYYSLFNHPASDKESRDVLLKFSEFFVYLSVFIIFVIYAAWFRNCFK